MSLMYSRSTDNYGTMNVIFILMFPVGFQQFTEKVSWNYKFYVQTKCIQGEVVCTDFLQGFEISLWSIINNKWVRLLFFDQKAFSTFSSIIILWTISCTSHSHSLSFPLLFNPCHCLSWLCSDFRNEKDYCEVCWSTSASCLCLACLHSTDVSVSRVRSTYKHSERSGLKFTPIPLQALSTFACTVQAQLDLLYSTHFCMKWDQVEQMAMSLHTFEVWQLHHKCI